MGRVRLGVGIGLNLYFWTVMLIQYQQNILIQEHFLLKHQNNLFDLWISLSHFVSCYSQTTETQNI